MQLSFMKRSISSRVVGICAIAVGLSILVFVNFTTAQPADTFKWPEITYGHRYENGVYRLYGTYDQIAQTIAYLNNPGYNMRLVAMTTPTDRIADGKDECFVVFERVSKK